MPLHLLVLTCCQIAVAAHATGVGSVPGLWLWPRQGHSQEDGCLCDEDLLPDHHYLQVRYVSFSVLLYGIQLPQPVVGHTAISW